MVKHACNSPHFVCFFGSESSRARSVYRYLASALRAGQPGIVLAKPDLVGDIKKNLHREHVEGVPFGPDRGELLLLDAVDTLDRICVDGSPDADLFEAVVGDAVRRLAAGGQAVAAYGELVGVLCERGQHADALRLEDLWNELLASVDASLFCGYTRALFNTPEAVAVYDAICAVHTSRYDEASGFTPAWV